VADDLTIQFRRIGERRTWLLRRLRPEYEIAIVDEGQEKYRGLTITPSSALVTKGKVHTTDSWDWIRAADDAYARRDKAWISDPFRAHGSE
jgi:hypothetical protein